MRRVLSAVLFSASLLGASVLAGCHGPTAHAARYPVTSASVADDDLALAYAEYAYAAPSADVRAKLAKSLGERLLSRAKSELSEGRERAAMVTLRLGLGILRVHGVAPTSLSPDAISALEVAVDAPAARGDEGPALTLYKIIAAARPTDAKAREHLDALEGWLYDGDHSVRELSLRERRLTRHSAALAYTLDMRDVKAADAEGIAWIERLAPLERIDRAHGSERAEFFDEYMRSTALRILSHHLRDGDVAGAMTLADHESVRPKVASSTRAALADVASSGSASAYHGLVNDLYAASKVDGLSEPVSDAVIGVSLRGAPQNPHDTPIAEWLARGALSAGLTDVAPALLARALLGTEDDARRPATSDLSRALGIAVAAIREDDGREDYAAARRAFRAAIPLLAAADEIGGVTPSAGSVRALMAQLEGEAGDTKASAALVDLALEHEENGAALAQRARLLRAAGDFAGARKAVKAALESDERQHDVLAAAVHRAIAADLARGAGEVDTAKREYAAAIAALRPVLSAATGVQAALVSAHIAEILGRFDAAETAEDEAATAAESAASGNPRLLGRIALGRFQRPLRKLDPKGARAALRRVVDLGVPSEDVVIAAVLTRAIVARAGAAADSLADQKLEAAANKDDEAGRLAKLALGKANLESVVAAAKSARTAQLAELVVALSTWTTQPAVAKASLQAIAQGRVVGSVASMLAEVALDPARGGFPGAPSTP